MAALCSARCTQCQRCEVTDATWVCIWLVCQYPVQMSVAFGTWLRSAAHSAHNVDVIHLEQISKQSLVVIPGAVPLSQMCAVLDVWLHSAASAAKYIAIGKHKVRPCWQRQWHLAVSHMPAARLAEIIPPGCIHATVTPATAHKQLQT